MITTDEDVKMEEMYSIIIVSHFFSSSIMHSMPYTLIVVIILCYSSHRY